MLFCMYLLQEDYNRYKGGFLMKVLIASTHEQEEKIQELINYMYFTVFPQYFTDDEIQYYNDLKVLHTTTRHFEYFGTLKEAFQVITGLQTLISILECHDQKQEYDDMFDHNVQILQEFGLFFPFSLDQFLHPSNCEESISIYGKATNELLV
jgi:hypothetical protein